MFLDLSFWKIDIFHMSLDLCRYCLTTMLCRSWFSTYGLVDGVVVLKVNFDYIEMEENTMCFDEAQDATTCLKRKKTLLSLFFSLV
jgi:hypothetical protein